MTIGVYEASDEAAVIDLWRRCGLVVPQNNPREDIRRKVADSPELFLVGKAGAEVVATVMAGYDGHRGWVNYLAVAPHLQRGGHGRAIMAHAEELLRRRGCAKINLQVRSTNERVIAFYRRIGFSIDEVASMGKRLVVDTPLEDGEQKA
ncbi:MAG TPA: GNAT family acetyltransferase [Tepidisphaeraceae bacterium]|nr:GNAT family acetyltransferase [Tepidisphaeraceae bacterium]